MKLGRIVEGTERLEVRPDGVFSRGIGQGQADPGSILGSGAALSSSGRDHELDLVALRQKLVLRMSIQADIGSERSPPFSSAIQVAETTWRP